MSNWACLSRNRALDASNIMAADAPWGANEVSMHTMTNSTVCTQYCIHVLNVRASIPNDSGMTMRNILAEGADLSDTGSLHGDLEVDGFSHVHLLVKQLR